MNKSVNMYSTIDTCSNNKTIYEFFSLISLVLFLFILGITKNTTFKTLYDIYHSNTISLYDMLINIKRNQYDASILRFSLIMLQSFFLMLYVLLSSGIRFKKTCITFITIYIIAYIILLFFNPINFTICNFILKYYGYSLIFNNLFFINSFVLNSFVLEFVLLIVILCCSDIKAYYKLINISFIVCLLLLLNHIAFMVPYVSGIYAIPLDIYFGSLLIFFLSNKILFSILLIVKSCLLMIITIGTIIYCTIYCIVKFKKFFKLMAIPFSIMLVLYYLLKVIYLIFSLFYYFIKR